MRYRMEFIEDDLVIHNVEADVALGTAQRWWINDPRDPDRGILAACTIVHKDAGRIATISTTTVPNPLEQAAVAIANFEAHCGYPGFKAAAECPRPMRIEYLLGTLLADAASAIARAMIENSSGGLTPETKENCAELISQLYAIRFASHFGSFDAERRVFDPYFANTPPSRPRMSFGAAAQHYGMRELRERYPDVSEAQLKQALLLPIELLSGLHDHLHPPQPLSADLLCLFVKSEIELGIW